MSKSYDRSRVVNLRNEKHSVEPTPLDFSLVKGEARLLGSLVRNGKLVDYYVIDDGDTVSYVYSERSDGEMDG